MGQVVDIASDRQDTPVLGAPSARARALLWIEDPAGLSPDVPAQALRRLRAEAAAAASRIASRPPEEEVG
jgi:hypothetical protein